MAKHKPKLNRSVFLTVAFFVMVCYFFVSFFTLRSDVAAKEAELDTLKEKVVSQQGENARLQKTLDDDDLDAFVERRARDEDLGYVYPDERVYYDLSAGQ